MFFPSKCILAAGILLLATVSSFAAAPPKSPESIEARILGHIGKNLRDGQPVLVTDLYGKIFTKPEERKVLGKLFRSFFRIPLFLVDHQEKLGKHPSLKDIAAQFSLEGPESADVLLRVMEADPRVPPFIERDEESGEIVGIDAEMIRRDRRFSAPLERRLTGWEGQAAELTLEKLGGGQIALADLKGKSTFLYVWFTGCPPCMEMTPHLVELYGKYAEQGFTVVAANADRHLELGNEEDVIHRYIEEQKIHFPVAHWDGKMDRFYGSIAIFPTSFLIDSEGTVARHYVGYQTPEKLEADLKEVLGK